MSQKNNTRYKVVFLVALGFSLITAYGLPLTNNPANRPSSLNQNRKLVPYFDRIEALLRSNEDNEEKQPQATATSIPTHTHASPSWHAKTQAPYLIKTNITPANIEGFFFLKKSDLLSRNNLVVVSNLGLMNLSRQLRTMSPF